MISVKEHIISIIKIIVFIVTTFVMCFCLNGYFIPMLGSDTVIISGLYGEKNNSLDMVYIGGSACFVYYQPFKTYNDYGFTSYNFGANTIQAEFYKYMIDEVLKEQSPDLIVLDARAFQYRDKDQPPTDVAYRNVLTGMPLNINKAKFIERYVRSKLGENDTLSYYFSFIRFHSAPSYERYSLSEGIKMITGNYKHVFKGQMLVPRIEKQEYIDYKTEEEKVMEDDTVKILDELLEYLKTKNIKVLFVVSPYIEEKEHKKVFNYVERRVKEAGFDFIDANDYKDEMNIDYDIDFYNSSHMNVYGSDKYTDFLNKYISDNYKLKDHRNDAEYNDWNQQLEVWKENKQSVYEIMEEAMELENDGV